MRLLCSRMSGCRFRPPSLQSSRDPPSGGNFICLFKSPCLHIGPVSLLRFVILFVDFTKRRGWSGRQKSYSKQCMEKILAPVCHPLVCVYRVLNHLAVKF